MMPHQRLTVHLSHETDPFFNLALEDYLFRQLEDNDRSLYLWRNQATVVIGRSQNPWVECNLSNMAEHDVQLTRRQSGGGAVYQDLGNSNFTFLNANPNYDESTNTQIVQNALNSFGVDVQPKGRNDLVVDVEGNWRKISGSAFRQTQRKSFHHGTLMLDVDFARLQACLQPNDKKLQSKGVRSVSSRVVNLADLVSGLSHETVVDALHNEFERYHQRLSTVWYWDKSALDRYPQLSQHYQWLASWDWRFGKTLAFTHRFETRFDWGTIDIRCLVDKGLIQNVQVFSDTLYPDFVDWLHDQLPNIRYSQQQIKQALAEGYNRFPQLKGHIDQLVQWIAAEVEAE
jgi:lipoate-protein ligase A